MNTQFTEDQLKLFFSDKYHHSAYEESVAAADALRVHADGTFPEKLIGERRPNESEAVQEYREAIFQPITKPYFNKIITSLNKIRRSTEWSVRFDADSIPGRIIQGESLEDYLMGGLPEFTSLINWVFSFLLREYSVEANGWIAVMPKDNGVAANEYVRPFPYLFRADQVIDYMPEQYVVFKSDDKVVYKINDASFFGDMYYIVTPTTIERWEQTGGGRTFSLASVYEHNIGEMPAFRVRGSVKKVVNSTFFNDSRLSPVLPRFDEALREYSDLQAEVVQHIHSERWEMGQDECMTCKGSGKVTIAGFGGHTVGCDTCSGSGYRPRGPYTKMIVKPSMAGEQNQPTPPMGYVQKTTDIVKTQDERIDKHIYHGLSAINMEFLAERPINESGVAKAYDSDETNNFAHSVAEDLVAMMDDVAYFTNEMRYSILLPDAQARQAMLPTIAVPERFDLFSAAMVEEELLNARAKNINPIIMNAIEVEYANKKFSTNPEVRDLVALSLQLNPVPNMAEEVRVVMLQNGGITKESYVISCNIYQFIARALDEKGEAFYTMDLKDQKTLMVQYAKEQVDNASATKQILSDFNQGG